MEALLAFLSSPLGQGLAVAVALGALGVLFAVARKLNHKFGLFAKKTPNKIDDAVHDAIDDVLDAGEPAAKELVKVTIEAQRKK